MVFEHELSTDDCEFAQRFLQTAVVVDDEAYIPTGVGDQPQSGLVLPSQGTESLGQGDPGPVDHQLHRLDASSIMDAFSKLGVICGVVDPANNQMSTIKQADIVILDWLLDGSSYQDTLKLIKELLTIERDQYSLRLLAIYTGESALENISGTVSDLLMKLGLNPNVDERTTTISYQHGRVVLYAKSGVSLAEHLKDRSVEEEVLPSKLLEDFASMTSGLLPGITLTSLAAVREGAHKVLEQFSAKLDPAYLTHRACLSDPHDSERQIVNHIAEELRGLMDNAVAETSPAGSRAVENWLQRKGDVTSTFAFGNRNLELEDTIKLANEGYRSADLNHSVFQNLTAGFAQDCSVDLDEQLAWIMSFRTVYNAPAPTLWLGTVVADSSGNLLLCVSPRCDCVRLKEETKFRFVQLVEPKKPHQIVVRSGEIFSRLGIDLDPRNWKDLKFLPTPDRDAVIAEIRESDGGFGFTDVEENKYTWKGELKAEYAQRIAQAVAERLSRVAIDESEWLRRMTNKTRS